jgi:hypothetical protein
MNIEKNLKRWVDASLIEQEQADAIVRFERESPSASWILFGISGLGVVVMLTGLVSIIAANWYEISPLTKLVVFFVSLAMLGWFTWRRTPIAGVVRESLFVALALYLLAGIGLVGQTYHLESDGYSAIFFWLGLILPLALLGSGRLLSHLWFLGLTLGVLSWIFSGSLMWSGRPSEEVMLDRAFITMAIPYVLLTFGYGLGHILSVPFGNAARLWAYVCILVPFAVTANIVWEFGGNRPDVFIVGTRPLIPT